LYSWIQRPIDSRASSTLRYSAVQTSRRKGYWLYAAGSQYIQKRDVELSIGGIQNSHRWRCEPSAVRRQMSIMLAISNLRFRIVGAAALRYDVLKVLGPSFQELAVQEVKAAPDRRYSTVSWPFIFRCPKPQKCEHSNGKEPARSAVNSIMTGSPFGNVRPMLNASSLNP